MKPSSTHAYDTGAAGAGRKASAIITALLLALGVAACSWSVPADPGLNSKLRLRPAAASANTANAPMQADGYTDAGDPGASALYYDHCSRCHAPFAPTYVTAGEWPRYVRRYAPRAGLYGADRQRVLTWLQANAR
jgi:hypothetical protein